MDRETVISDIEQQIRWIEEIECHKFPGWLNVTNTMRDALALLKEQDEEHRRLLSWLGKFCRHIDNGDAWLTDEENIAFFKEKMKQQFGWNTD